MAENIALAHGGNTAVVEMDIRATNGRQADLNNGIPRVEDRGLWHGFHTHIASAIPTDSLHTLTSLCVRACCIRDTAGWFAIVGISPASIICLQCRSSSWSCPTVRVWKSLASATPATPPGGAYATLRRTSVPRPFGSSRKRTVPVLSTSAPGRERHDSKVFSRSSTHS